MFEKIMKNLKEKKPLVHNITNYVTVNDCANILLSIGASPIMADDINEVEEITGICNALVINIGTLNERTIASMIKAGKRATLLGRPVILDPVGAGASSLRTFTARQLLDEAGVSVIRGNISEIKAILGGTGTTRGVDADENDLSGRNALESAIAAAEKLAAERGCAVIATGKTDVVATGSKTYLIGNGHRFMSRITGTGCMLSAMVGALCAANPADIPEACVCTVAAMGIAGEMAYRETEGNSLGTASFRTLLIDYCGKIDSEVLERDSKIETA